MPRIAGVSIAVPPNVLEQSEARARVLKMFGPIAERLAPVFDNAKIDRRHFAAEIEWFEVPHSFTETNDRYIAETLVLAERVVCDLAEQCGISTTDFDAIFFVSTTGLSTPSIDARLFNRIPLNPHIKRIPIWGLGCAAGVGGIARAFDYVKAFPRERALVVSVELCSFAFQLSDRSKSNVIASALFGDGAAACLVVGDEVEVAGPRVLGSLSTTYRDTLDVMGWRISSEGFRIVLSRDIPSIVTSLVAENIQELLAKHKLDLSQITHFIAHPGGVKVIEAYEQALAPSPHAMRHSYDVLRANGNMSSATVLFILKRFLEENHPGSGEYGIITALGPGFSSELVLVQW
ncbi:MAG: 3-oxoacyl-[acyl-carrier-protein] synthase III C-terminal domain-containing protein [Bacteroidota bacterium]|nr:3-oxoacyl-[acyl-carrier-protein] synthase III C-terminal domain-containing protein [Bacteroidota bacterium]MDP4233944.1 3-oxoacyl-[acyl-carrier-protein] synthase III C-terminal domain-containing protein [Bacteroidota bacterium]MDP4242805.1 3-oxoacyl-[acyl-carrier-protein] synthase III C-terminal domain-containing protein [Bacteroidota bacterium]MDP4288519.1 3-oxoacyl-[acyl-carrier-protein] synthase III C-terminal domain-containing protein [Bacteroidota bacterium]